jgi:hypothetical protein
MLTRDEAQKFFVVRGVLLGELTLEEGTRMIAITMTDLSRLVAGARAAVIRTLGPQALDDARQPERVAI